MPLHRPQREGREDEAPEQPSLYAELGVPHEFLPDEQAPPVNEELLRRLARRELSAAEAEQVHALLVKFRPWASAYADVLGKIDQSF